MKHATCSRLWEVEAARDGRLFGDALVAHEEHVARCRECERERRVLAELGEALRSSQNGADEVSLRRTRRAILQHADEAWRAPPRARRQRSIFGAALAAVAVVAATWWVLRPSSPPRNAAVVSASPGSRWHRVADQSFERIALSEGGFEVVVQRREDDRPVRVNVPEGEIEDMGTAFSVTVHEEHTQEIRVHEGSIVLHRRGMPDARVWAGEAWHAPVSAPAPATVDVTAGVASDTTPPTTTPTPTPSPSRVNETSNPRVAPVAPRQMRSAHRSGARDSYREDSSYLRILSLVREGRIKEAHSAALAYSKEFPRGFRRDEVDRILRRTGD